MNRRKIIVFVSGPYSAKNKDDIDRNISVAREYAIELMELGFMPITPHLNTIRFQDEDCKCGYEDYLNGYLEILSRCDAVFMLPGWVKSRGAYKEYTWAGKKSLPIFHSIEDIDEYYPK